MANKAQGDWGKLKKTKWNRSKRNKQQKYTRDTCWQSVAHIQQEIQSIATAQFKNMKKKMSKCSTVDSWRWINLPWPKNWRNFFSTMSNRNRDKMTSQTGNFQMRCQAWHHCRSHSICCLLRKCPNSILITDEVLTAVKIQGSQLKKFFSPHSPEIMVQLLVTLMNTAS